jgi:uncharacterized protein (DUF58 family)
MPLPRYQYFAPTDAARMSKLQFTARQAVEGAITGLHKSPHRGFSVEFAEHREYVAGDELRHLDWKVYSRSDRYYVKLYEQETNLRTTIVIDTSASMKFPVDPKAANSSAITSKIDYAKHLAACLAYLLAHQQDLAGLAAIDESIRVELPPASSPSHLDLLFKYLEAIEASGATGLVEHLHHLAERLPRRSLIILITDLWVDAAELSKALQHLRYRRHQGLVLHLLDRAELDLSGPNFQKQVTLQDLETGEKLQIDPADLREHYKKQVEEYRATVRRVCNDSDIEYHAMMIDEPYDKALVRLITRRS